MIYLEFQFFFDDRNPIVDVFKQVLADIGFEAFQEGSTFFKAYIPQKLYNKQKFDLIYLKYDFLFSSFDIYEKPYENWNKKWESEFEIININDQCSIRASFHPPTNKKFDIIINPEMSFGTGHHETTRLMAKELFNHQLNEKSVLDFGSGTAILSIISAKLGAKYIDAVEIDNKVNDSALENLKINNTLSINLINGKGENIPEKKYDFILININRNTIVEEFKYFLKVVKNESVLILSGFLYSDVNYISDFLKKSGLNILNSSKENDWVVLVVKK
ncbi:MAG: 50S ribosomal protein L11 methyltransferase [Parvicellaceae bacterium]